MQWKLTLRSGIGYLLAVGLLVVLMAGPAAAWKVTVKNDTEYQGHFAVNGEHVFWVSTDFLDYIDAGKSQDVEIANGICPAAVQWSLQKDGKGINNGDTNRSARCWNSNFRLYYDNGLFKWEWK
jgi:hypothetical protein